MLSIPGQGTKIPYASEQSTEPKLLSPHVATREPALHNEWSWMMQQSFRVPQLRPNSQINKIILKNLKQVRFQHGSILKTE